MTQGRAREWEHFPHGADIGVRGWGATADEAFERAAVALTAVVTEPARVRLVERIEISCSAPDLELLFADWLNAIVFAMATRRMVFGKFEVRISGNELRAWATGEPVNRARHRPAVEVKGATYTELHVGRDDTGGWIAQCVVDV